MVTYRWNGECWYADRRGPWKRARQWLIWVGGWETANGAGWRFRIPYINGRHLWMSPTPVSILGHWATWYGWGLTVRFGWWSFTWDWRVSRHAYLSTNGTPNGAFHWLWGAPRDVREAAAAKTEKAA